MTESLRSKKPFLENDPGPRGELTEEPLYASNFDDSQIYSEGATHKFKDWEPLHRRLDPPSLHFGDAHEIVHINMPGIGFGFTEVTALDPPPLGYALQPTRRKNDIQILNTGRAFTVEEPPVAPRPPSQPPTSRPNSAPPQALNQHYGPFLGRFLNSEHAKIYRRDKMRFGRMPWRDPESDPTIAETENNRDFHVERIYNAMVCGDSARDNANSTAMKRWVYGAHYTSDLVEAYAHKVFDCLLEQVKKGFRGWHQNDYVNDDRKGDDDDKDIDCAGRLDNIITALQQEKSICENVMSSAWQIRMFVNAPKAYAKRKDQNRVGNSKRPNVKSSEGAESEPRSSKKARNAATTQSKTVGGGSKTPQSRLPATTTIQRQQKRPLRSASNGSASTNAMSKMPSMGLSPVPSASYFGEQANGALPSPNLSLPVLHTSPQHNSELGILTPPVQQRRALPPPSPYGNLPKCSTPDTTTTASMGHNVLGWPIEPPLNFLPSTSSPLEFTAKAVSGEPQQDIHHFPPCDAVGYTNLFDGLADRGGNLFDVELVPLSGINEGLEDNFFNEFWDLQQTDVQQIPDTTQQQEYL
ncbi:hypothetical protein yc1106_05997 [Curvularia clavata]|uniref:Uncharacterized protein n=1 Tax=Curvularia clavata TaxID=95742 RepID=A0A9Q8ZEF7_CURCL|nr:hypothetical protein yc1106_05997 [Curvularia clavata]